MATMQNAEKQMQNDYLSYTNNGYKEYNLGNYLEAKRLHLSALELAKKLKNENLICKANTNIGNCFFRMGEFDESLYHHLIAEEIAEQSKETFNPQVNLSHDIENAMFELPGIKNHIGIVYLHQDLISKAEIEFKKGEEIATELLTNATLKNEIKEKLEYAQKRIRISKIGILESEFKWTEVEQQYLGLIKEITQDLSGSKTFDATYNRLNTRFKAILTIGLASFYMEQDNLDQAKILLEEGKTIAEKLNDIETIRYAKFKIARLASVEGRLEDALKLLNEPIFQLKEKGGLLENKKDLIDFYALQSEIFAEENDFEHCIQFLFKVQSELSTVNYDTGMYRLIFLLVKLALRAGLLETARDLITVLDKDFQGKVKKVDPNKPGSTNCHDEIKIIIQTLSGLISKPPIYVKKWAEIRELYTNFCQLNRDPKSNIPPVFIGKGYVELVNLFFQNFSIFYSEYKTRREEYEPFTRKWHNFYRRKFTTLTEITLEELVALRYNEEHLRWYDDCIRKLFTAVEMEIFHHFLTPIKILFKKNISQKKEYTNPSKNQDKYEDFFTEFYAFLKNDHDDLRFVVIESILLSLTTPPNTTSSLNWDELLTDLKNCITSGDLIHLKKLADFLKKRWKTTIGQQNFRQMRNTIVHPTRSTLSKQELQDLFLKLKKEIIGDDNKPDETNLFLSELIQLKCA